MKKKLFICFLVLVSVFSIFAEGQMDYRQILNNLNVTIPSNTETVSSSTYSSPYKQTTSSISRLESDMSSLTKLYRIVETNYLYDIDYDAVYDAMATAMFEALGDKYSEYVLAADTADFVQQTEGKYGGLGIVFSKADKYCLIEQVYANTPASKCGLAAKDQITHIDGQPVDELINTECAALMKGNPGESVTLTILRKETSFDVTLVRAIVTIPSIEYTMLEDKIGYVLITEFYNETLTSFKNAMNELIMQGMESLIIDLRDCPGGDVNVTLSILDMFISDSMLLKICYKNSSYDTVKWASRSIAVPSTVKVAILVNGGSASASEIFCSSMQDNKRATLIGTTTFGKGIMQSVAGYGEDTYKLTVASYYPPSGKEIHGKGVEPDIVVEDIAVLEEEMDAYMEFYNSKEVTDFVDQHPKYNKENSDLFVEINQNKGLRDIILRYIIRNEYYSRLVNEDIPLVDTELDPVVISAIEYLKTN